MIMYKVVEHLPHEVHQDGVVFPLLDVVLEQDLLLLLLEVRHDHLLNVLDECVLEVVVQISCLVQLVAELENHTIERVRVS